MSICHILSKILTVRNISSPVNRDRPSHVGRQPGAIRTDFHDQIFFDAAYSSMVMQGPDVTKRGVHEPIYNEAYLPSVATADGTQTALLQHVFSGDCAAGKCRCRRVVRGERWSHFPALRSYKILCMNVNRRRKDWTSKTGVRIRKAVMGLAACRRYFITSNDRQ